MILKVGTSEGIEVGRLPRDVGLDLLRWNGRELVNISELDEFWVSCNNGVYQLHSIQVPNSQKVKMQYKDRKKLHNDGGKFKVKSERDINNDNNMQYRKSHYPEIGDQLDAILKWIDKLDLPKDDELEDIIIKCKEVKQKFKKE
jgi:hypothetical protein